ncbi:proline racemase family protein, partial [Clostridioides difficile]|nr:proline racemase family protein [Clostridioides difficile]
ADFNVVLPKITASAYITGFNHFVIDEEDPLKHGFILK